MQRLGEALRVDPGETCLAHAELAAHVLTWRSSAFLDAGIEIFVLGSKNPRNVEFEIRLNGKLKARRIFENGPARCSDLHAAVGLALAIGLDDAFSAALDIDRPKGPPVSIQNADAMDLPPRVGLESTDGPESPDKSRPRSARISASFQGLLGVRLMPTLSGGGAFTFNIGLTDSLELRLGALSLFSPPFDLGEGTVKTRLTAGNFDFCSGPHYRRVHPRGCIGLAAGAIRPYARGYRASPVQVFPWLAVDAGLDMNVHLGPRTSMQLGAQVFLPLLRTRLEVREIGEDTLVTTAIFPAIGGIVSFGVTIVFH